MVPDFENLPDFLLSCLHVYHDIGEIIRRV